jgi:hypothetical protein
VAREEIGLAGVVTAPAGAVRIRLLVLVSAEAFLTGEEPSGVPAVAVIGRRPRVFSNILVTSADVVLARVFAGVFVVGKLFVGGLVEGILRAGHAVPTHSGARRLSVDSSPEPL